MANQTFCVVGKSGSSISATAHSILQIIPIPDAIDRLRSIGRYRSALCQWLNQFTRQQAVATNMMMHYNRLDNIMDSDQESRRMLDAIRSGDESTVIGA